MRTACPILLAAIALAGTGLAATPAAACVINPITCYGNSYDCNPSPMEKLAEEKRVSEYGTRLALAESRKRLGAGDVDLAAELSELLVPNVRPIFTERGTCLPMGEIDHGEGEETAEGAFAALTEGTPLAGAKLEHFSEPLHRAEEPLFFGAQCNAEFRRGFAGWLRQALTPSDLRHAWLFLRPRQRGHGPYGSVYHRLVIFQGKARTPPIRWWAADRWLGDQIDSALRRTGWGRSLSGAMDAFWTAKAGDLAVTQRVCPSEYSGWTEMRERLLPRLIEWQSAQRLPEGKR